MALGRERFVALDGLTALDAEVLIDFVERQPGLRELAQKRGLSVLEFLDWWHTPPIEAALEALLRFHAFRRDLRHAQLREELVAILAQVAKTSPNPVEQRRAATTALGAMATPARRGEARRGYGSFPHAGRPGPRSGAGFAEPPWRSEDSYRSSPPRPHAPASNGAPPRAPHAHLPPSGEVPERPRPRPAQAKGAFSSTASTPSRAHNAPAPNGALDTPAAGGVKVKDSPWRGEGSPWRRGSAPIECDPSRLPRAQSTVSNGIQEPAERGDGDADPDPEGTLAIAHHVLQAVESDPDAYPPEAIRAAHVYISLAGYPEEPSPSGPIRDICGFPASAPIGAICGSPPRSSAPSAYSAAHDTS